MPTQNKRLDILYSLLVTVQDIWSHHPVEGCVCIDVHLINGMCSLSSYGSNGYHPENELVRLMPNFSPFFVSNKVTNWPLSLNSFSQEMISLAKKDEAYNVSSMSLAHILSVYHTVSE